MVYTDCNSNLNLIKIFVKESVTDIIKHPVCIPQALVARNLCNKTIILLLAFLEKQYSPRPVGSANIASLGELNHRIYLGKSK